ncbi:MAG: hypothetical protein AB8B87_22190 [Granulosicoccus sp.]
MSLPQIVARAASCLSASALLALALTAGQASAFDKLNEAQTWIYDHGHLANTTEGQVLNYRYASQDDALPRVSDEASISITGMHEDGRRDVKIDFLSDERRLPLPPFTGFRGNPVIIAMLEHIAQSISSETGGGALYFRNRIRDALASSDVEMEERKINYNDNEVIATRITFYPFINDQHIGSNELVRESRFSIDLSDDIPGGVLSVEVKASRDAQVFERTLSLM